MQLSDTVAVVTGAGVGIGRAIAERLASEGATVVAVDRDAERGAETVCRIETAGGCAHFGRFDLSRADSAETMIAWVLDGHGGVDVVINNAGGGAGVDTAFPDADPQAWLGTLEVNLIAPMRATQAALPAMVERGGGVVVNVGSSAGIGLGPHGWPEYAVAKAGLIRLTTTLATLAEESNVRVNCVVPDWVATERALGELAAMPEAERAAQAPLVPLDAVTDAVVWSVTDESLAGRVIQLDRGEPPRLLSTGGGYWAR